MGQSFEVALQARADAMADACTRCGKCVEVCPSSEAAGLSALERQNPVHVIDGIIDILRSREGYVAARKWADGCLLSGDCIKACDYGVNPRFLLQMARIAMVHGKDDAATQRRKGVEGFRHVANDVKHISRLQLDDVLLERLGQKPASNPRPLAGEGREAAAEAAPDFVFYTGCNVLKT
ncbi:MAG: (Fe-S)-binding protein, partial [Xanthobacteraceae bacterium]